MDPVGCRSDPIAPMPTWPPAPERRTISLELPEALLAWADREAQAKTCSRAAFIRGVLIAEQSRAKRQASRAA